MSMTFYKPRRDCVSCEKVFGSSVQLARPNAPFGTYSDRRNRTVGTIFFSLSIIPVYSVVQKTLINFKVQLSWSLFGIYTKETTSLRQITSITVNASLRI